MISKLTPWLFLFTYPLLNPYNKVTGCVFVCLFVCTQGSLLPKSQSGSP